MPMIAYLKERFPGACFDPREYIPRVLDNIIDLLNLGDLDPILI